MELFLPTSLSTTPSVPLSHSSSVKLYCNGFLSRQSKLHRKSNLMTIPLRIEQDWTLKGHLNEESTVDCDNFWGDSKNYVEVIAIGSRKDAVIDFCLESPFRSSSPRFWNIILKDLLNLQLLQRSIGEGFVLRNVEGPVSLQSCPRVASSGYGSDHITAAELLRTVKSANGLAVGIILKPFSFEGQRRQDEVKDLVNKLQEHTNFCIVVDTDALLKKEAVTLADALKSANNAVLLCINAVSVLASEGHTKLIEAPCQNTKELSVPEVLEILKSYKEAKVGFGAGYNMKSSIARAIFECPFLGGDIKNCNGVVLCTLASAGVMDSNDLHAFLHTFRQATGCTGEIIVSVTCEPNLEPNLIVTTIVVLGCDEQEVSSKNSFLSRLALHFPFIFSLWGKDHPKSSESSEFLSSSNGENMSNSYSAEDSSEDHHAYSKELKIPSSGQYDEICASRECNSQSKRKDAGLFNATTELDSDFNDQVTAGETALEREQIVSWNVGPGFYIAQEWAKERAAISMTPMFDSLSVYSLPVGVRPSEQSRNIPQFVNTAKPSEPTTLDAVNGEPLSFSDLPSWDALRDVGFQAVTDIRNAASTYLKGKNAASPQKQGQLSVRAASMLEAERDSQKKWSPIMEMKYRGGIYRGRCQGGLPEGKGCLTFVDGSIYDGIWRYGKKSGLGALYYSNGDVFQGTWRDDLMHGKGWFYFHTGDRWFANFWKGKANGEARFYSKFGDVFFGHFQDGWRHGHFLCIDVDGTRWIEIWEEGVLLNRKQDSEFSAL
ncbi:protein ACCUMULATION AND REPLICATION OF CHLOROPLASTS 3 isoform X3 [Telopea speciosissima]|uniref:protein ACCUMULATION AND REPLICATION OF CHLOROPLASTS 3 isoform X3 n=1 Tax=Telopea speciosissima TaxID=54955 RepID=UPI001CC3E231|nr:protein ACCUMULATION AND REPLICATION OF CHLOROPLASTS 3 isoform X3 [Telopea speciosissima]